MELLDYDRDEPHVQLNQQYQYDRDWFKVDTYSLVIEGVYEDSPSTSYTEGSIWLSADHSEEPRRVSEKGSATKYKSLVPRAVSDEEFIFDFSDSYIRISDTTNASCNTIRPVPLADVSSIIPFPGRMLGDMYTRFRALAREARRVKFLEEEEAIKKEIEQQLIRKKQQVEIQQKQKDLVQLALKRAAQNKKPIVTTVSTPPIIPAVHPSPQSHPVWAGPPPPVLPHLMIPPPGLVGMQPMMIPPNPWSANPTRPMVPPPMPMHWAPVPHHFVPQPVDPWSSAAAASASVTVPPVRNPWASSETSEPKRPKVEETTDSDKQRMARLGVPFK